MYSSQARLKGGACDGLNSGHKISTENINIDNPNYYYLSRKQNLLNKYSTGTDTGTP